MAKKPEEMLQAEFDKLRVLRTAKPAACREFLGIGSPKYQTTRLVMESLHNRFHEMTTDDWDDADIRKAFGLVMASLVLLRENANVPFLV